MGGDAMSGHNEDERQTLRDAQAMVAAEQIHQAMTDGTLTFGDYPPDEAEQILAALPAAADLDATTVPTSVRLPYPLHQQLRAYAEEHDTTASSLIRQWVEQMLTVPDRPISLADAVRALSTLPAQGHQQAA
jgi:predicted DNA-binding protein